MSASQIFSRRRFLQGLTASAPLWSVPGLFAEELVRTPRQTEGPFYPNRLPLDTDNDLLIINDSITPAVGAVTHLTGRILDSHGRQIRNALVEIWQVDNNGAYIHTESANRDKRDGHFQGFGRFLTGSTGEYYFRTIKPVPYRDRQVSRTSHIHFAVKVKGQETFTTQCYVKGEPKNQADFILNSIRDAKARSSLLVDFKPLDKSAAGELAAKFDIVLGLTLEM